MADLTIRVGTEHADLLAGELLRRYAALTGELHDAARRHAAGRDGLQDLLGLRVELLDLDDALEQLDWGVRPGSPVELTAHPEVLADAVTGALAAAAQRVARERREPAAPGADAGAGLRALAGLLELTGTVLGT